MLDTLMFACDKCAHDIEHDVISDDEGYLVLTGRIDFYAVCDLCAEPASHVVGHSQELR